MRRSTLVASHVAVFMAGVVVATAVVASAVPDRERRPARDRYATLDSLAQALSYIGREYVDDVEEREIVYSAITGMVKSLDRHSAFLRPKSYQRLREDTEGEFGGVGFELGSAPAGVEPPYPIVEGLIDGSPAHRAGVAEGDRVVSVAGEATVAAGATVADDRRMRRIGALLRGPAGTRVELVIQRGAAAPETRALVRERVKVPTVEWFTLRGGIAYISLRRFQEASAGDVEAALEAAKRELGGTIGALLLDLRGNPGGLYDQAVRVADLFLEDGVIVKVVSRAGRSVETEVAHAPGTWSGFPIIALVDQSSASAAEIVAGALQDHRRATVLGLATYGKGSVQTFLDLADGSGLKLTTARYYTPNGRSLEGAGIQPDLVVEAFEADVVTAGGTETDAENHSHASAAGETPSSDATISSRVDEDHQLRVAYETARGWMRTRPAKSGR
ncbi:MAG TPA: S41 family peptidase [Kofleriaceae bacterium]|nr:S41 family peptidase [Kofleriaceae bacterium]